MARIVIADHGQSFDGRTAETSPLGGAEGALVALANAFARAGHDVEVRNLCAEAIDHRGVKWRPYAGQIEGGADLFIANRSPFLIAAMPGAARCAFWIHNPARYLLKPRYLVPLLRLRPVIVFSGPHHAASYPAWAPSGGRVTIPLGVDEAFRAAPPAGAPPPPRAVFTSNPLRGLDWLLDIWTQRVRPAAPSAELHVFAGAAVYGGDANPKAAAMRAVIDRAAALADRGVVVRAPLPKAELAREVAASRVMLYRGDPGETFCLALAEAQAIGTPAVIQPIGAVAERVRDGETGFVARDDDAFAADAVRLLTDDALWTRQHEAALATQRDCGWDEVAALWARRFLA